MSKLSSEEKKQELINIIKKEGSRQKGFSKFAEKYGVSEQWVKSYFYKCMLTPELDRELPRGKKLPVERFFNKQKEQELVDMIKAEGSREKCLIRFAEKYNIAKSGVRTHFYKHMLTPELDQPLPKGGHNSSRQPEITVEDALRDILKENNGDTPLTKEDIEAAAQKAGVHYHVALSTWGKMVQKGEAAIAGIHCADRNCLWLKGMAFASLLDSGITAAELARVTGSSSAEVLELAKTYRAFSGPGEREPSLTFYHHRIAANTENPRQWLDRAKEAGWSAWEMTAAIKGEPVLDAGALKKENAKLVAAVDFLLAMLAKNGIRVNGQWLKDIGFPSDMERLAALGLVFEDNVDGSEKVKWSEPGKTGMIISPPAEGLVSLGYITGLHDLISDLENEIAALNIKLAASRKVSVSALRMLQNKNRMHVRFMNGNQAQEHAQVVN